MRTLIVLALTLGLVACDDQGAEPPPVVAAPQLPEVTSPPATDEPAPATPVVDATPEPEDHFAVGPCTAGETHGLGDFTDRRGASGVAFDSVRGGLVIRTKDADHIEAWRLDASGAPDAESVEIELPGARDVKGLYRVGERFIAVTHALCPETRRSQKCLHLRTLDLDGAPVGDVFTHVTSEWIDKGFFVETDDGLVVLRSHTYIQPVLERYAVGADGGVSREELADVTHENEDGAGPRAVAVAVEGDRWGAIIANDLETTQLFLHSSDAPDGVRLTLPIVGAAALVELTFVEAGLRALLMLERGAPRVAVLALDGSVVEAPRELAADEGLAENVVVPVAAGGRDNVTFSRADLARRPIEGGVELPFNGMVSVDGDGLRYVLAFPGATRRRSSVGQEDTLEGSVTTIDCAPE